MEKINFKDINKDYYYAVKPYGDNLSTVGITDNTNSNYPLYFKVIVPTTFADDYKIALENFINNITDKTTVKELKLSTKHKKTITFRNTSFLSNKKISMREKFFAINFILDYASTVDRKLIKQVMDNYDTFMDNADFSLGVMVEAAFDVSQTYYNVRDYPFAHNVSGYALIKKIQDHNYYYYYNLLYCLLNDGNVSNDTIVREYSISDNIYNNLCYYKDNYMLSNIIKLPLYLPNFLDKVLDLRKDQIELMFGAFPTIVKDDDSALRVFNQIYGADKLTLADSVNTYNNIIQHFKDVVDVRTMLYLHERLLDKNTFILNNFLNALLDDFKVNNIRRKNDFDNLVNYFVGNRVVTWIRPRGYMEDVLTGLLEIMSPLEIYKIIICFGAEVERMTLLEWRDFITQYDDFKDFSPAWWRTLIAEKKL